MDPQDQSRYPFRCKHHKCHGPTPNPKPVYIHLHGTPSVRPEIQMAMLVPLQELFLPAFEGSYDTSFSNEVLHLHKTTLPQLAATIIQPVTTPDLHFHRVPHLASIEGIITGTYAGTPRPRDRAEARGVDHIGDEGPGMSSNGTQSKPEGNITRSVMRAPARAQEGEAFTLVAYTAAAGRLRGKVVLADCGLPLLREGPTVLSPVPQSTRDDEPNLLVGPGGPAAKSGGLPPVPSHNLPPLLHHQQGCGLGMSAPISPPRGQDVPAVLPLRSSRGDGGGLPARCGPDQNASARLALGGPGIPSSNGVLGPLPLLAGYPD